LSAGMHHARFESGLFRDMRACLWILLMQIAPLAQIAKWPMVSRRLWRLDAKTSVLKKSAKDIQEKNKYHYFLLLQIISP
jgi:hypothetical protein